MALVAGCAALAGIDEDYGVGGVAGSGASASGGGHTSTSTATAGGGMGATGGTGAAGGGTTTGVGGGSGGQAGAATYATCNEHKLAEPLATDGTYEVDLDGAAGPEPPFFVVCDMGTDGGGWTLVGQEHAGEAEHLAFLGVQQGTPADLVQGSAGLIGVLFVGRYSELRVTWENGAKYIQLSATDELFDNSVVTSIAVTDFATNDAELDGWVSSAGAAHFCRAAASGVTRPGDTSWAIKPADDLHDSCGCNSGGWAGQGAYYSGLSSCTSCNCWPGSFVGVRDNGEPKGELTTYTSQLWIR